MASGLIIRNGFSLDNFTTQANSSSYALSYDPVTGQIGYMETSSFTIGVVNSSQTASYATTGSNTFSGSQTITGSVTVSQNLTVLGTASFQYVTTIYETASVIYSSGSNQFGDATNDVQTLIGTTNISGALNVTASNFTLNIPSKGNGYVLQSDTNGNATWVSPTSVAIFPYTGSALITGSLGITGSLLIGINSSTNLLGYGGSYLNAATAITVEGPSGGPKSARILLHETTTDVIGPRIELARSYAGGALGANNDTGELRFWQAYANNSFVQGAYIKATTVSASSATSGPAKLSFGTTSSGSATPTQRMVISETGNVGIGALTASATLHVSGASMIFDIPSKSNGYILASDNNGVATWTNPTQIATQVQWLIATGSVTASVGVATASLFQITSASQNLVTVANTSYNGIGSIGVGINMTPAVSYSLDVSGSARFSQTVHFRALNAQQANTTPGFTGYSFAASESKNTGMFYYAPTVMVFDVSGQNVLKITNTSVTTNTQLLFGSLAGAPGITSDNNNNLILLTPTSSITYIGSGSIIFGPKGFYTGSKLNVAGDTYISGTLATSGSVIFNTLSNSAQTNIVGYNTSTGQLYYFPTSSIIANVFPYNGNAVISGSLTVTGSISVSSSLMINDSLSEYNKNLSLSSGVTTVFQRDTGSYTSAIVKYTVNKSTNARSGQFMIVWNGNAINDVDVSTGDIGNTNEITLQSALVAGQIQTNVSASSAGWAVKMLITYL